jgi:uncharacterized repeat protein (TIGR01451 family)
MIVGFTYQYPQNTNYVDSSKTIFRKYDSAMNLVWDTGPTDLYRADDLKVDAAGNTYGLGFYGHASNNHEMKVGKFDPSGNLQFINTFGLNAGGLSNYAYANLLLDSTGNPFVVGEYYPAGFVVSNPSDQFFIRRLDTAGVLLDMELFQSTSWFNFEFKHIIGNNLYLMTGSTSQAQIHRLCIVCPATISGTVYYDADSSCTYNSGDHGLGNQLVHPVPGLLYMHTDSIGNYHGFLPDNNYDVVFAPFMNYNPTCSADTIPIQIVNGVPVTQVNSGHYLNSTWHDLQLMQARGPVRPGFNTLFGIQYTNAGGSVQSGTLDFVHDSLFTFVQSNPPPDLVSGDTLRWNFSGMLQGTAQQVLVTLNTPVSATVGTTFLNTLSIAGNTPEATPADNMVIDSGAVTGSLDPNEKIAQPAGLGPQGFITPSDTAIRYTIHFENIGNDTAFTVLVIDTLDTDLDIATLRIGVASHPFTWQLKQGRILWFRFNNPKIVIRDQKLLVV